jgi:O-antigen/teichoic acid export membrane protein
VTSVVHRSKSLQARIVGGSIVLLSSSGLTTAINLVYNVEIARFLGAKGFGHATVVYTLLTLLSAVTLAFQIVTSKVIAQQEFPESQTAAYRLFHQVTWACGIVAALSLVAFDGPIANYLNLADPTLVALIAIGAAFYVPLGARRGYIQGTCGFRSLAVNMVVEQAVRLGGSLGLILLGFGVRGVVAANSAAIVVAYFGIRVTLTGKMQNPLRHSSAAREICQATVFFAGQMIINNCGIVLVDHFFLAREAGIYAAVAMIGRVIFSFSQAVVNSTFPLVAGTREQERRDLSVIATALMLVLGSGLMISLALCFVPSALWTHLFGPEFALAGKYDVPYLLAIYALATVIYSLGAVVITFEMSYKIANTSWVQLAFSGALIAAICFFHSSLRQVILIQLWFMIVLVVFVAVPFLINSLSDPKDILQAAECKPVRLIRRVSEDAAIAEFLKSDFHTSPFRDYQVAFESVVSSPNLENAEENAKRRALLNIRHLRLWKEIPQDTEWYEVEVNPAEFRNIRMFPRAQWRKVASGRFSSVDIAAGMRTRSHLLDPGFVSKIYSLRDQLEESEAPFGAVLLIGVSENEPLTLLDGNHRLMAAMLGPPESLQKLRFLCGLSPRMIDCCWYRTNLTTLFRYGRNMLKLSTHDPTEELARLLQNAS